MSTEDKIDLKKCKKSFMARRDDNGRLFDNVVNYGLKRFEQAYVRRNGEYHNFTVEALDDISPIITDVRVKQALKLLKKFDYTEAAKMLCVYSWFAKFGNDVIKYALDRWLSNNNLPTMYGVELDIDQKELNSLNDFVDLVRYDTLRGRLKIVSVGMNTKTKEPVVPESWANRVFSSGRAIHDAMNRLPHRKNKPPVHFCCIYGMSKRKRSSWNTVKSMAKKKLGKECKIIRIENNGGTLKTYITKKIDTHSDSLVLQYNRFYYIQLDKDIFQNGEYVKHDNVSYLASKLQKCYRRAEGVDDLMRDTITKLNYSPCYNLPDHHFARVSGARQLLWRTYISIIEDVNGYCNHEIDMFTLFSLALVAQKDPDLQLCDKILSKIADMAVKVTRIKTDWKWRRYKQEKKTKLVCKSDNNNRVCDSIHLALDLMPMMRTDGEMLRRLYTLIHSGDYKMTDLSKVKSERDVDKSIEEEIILSAFDMHCYPYILIELQGSLNFIPTEDYTLPRLSSFIWEYSSRYNDRIKFPEAKGDRQYDVINALRDIQYGYKVYKYVDRLDEFKFDFIRSSNSVLKSSKDGPNKNYVGRLAFINIFGGKFRLKSLDKKNPACEIIIAGDEENPIKVKRVRKSVYEFMEGEERDRAVNRFIKSFKETMIDLPKCVEGYRWNIRKYKKSKGGKKRVYIDIKMKDKKIKFYVNGKSVPTMNASSLIKRLCTPGELTEIPYDYDMLMRDLFYMNTKNVDMYDVLEQLRSIAIKRREVGDNVIYDWSRYGKNIPRDIWRQLYSRLIIGDNEKGAEVMVGPIDRRGKKTHNSISYRYEGVIWRLMVALESLYPKCIKSKTRFLFNINKETEEYLHLNRSLMSLIRSKSVVKYKAAPKLNTTLWEHQKRSLDKIFSGYTHYGKRGFGDASHVGAGKTLTALAIMIRLYEYNSTVKNNSHGGFVVMLPNTKLYKTWEDEIDKHVTGMDILYQHANGDLTESNNSKYKKDEVISPKSIKSNNILITTMGRMRDHPIQHPWVLVTIDECLTVQNKDALQTEEAWRQVCYSQYGVLMMSATFFRSRFDKMLFMLRMLTSGMPETAEYLDTILTETMVCNITENDRVWKINNNYYELSSKQKKEYNNIFKDNMDQAYDKLYSFLVSYIHNNVDYTKIFQDRLSKLDKDKRVVIFTKSKGEADVIAESVKDVGRYPEKLRHTVVSYSEGAYGLNDLVEYNTIIMRPPAPDMLPQIKGRLDRHGQKSKELYVEYIILKGTIEEASLDRLTLARNFYNNHIMPLSEFYKTATHYKP